MIRYRFQCFLEGMTERSMSKIMEQCREDGHLRTSFVEFSFRPSHFDLTPYQPEQLPRIVKNTNRMREARVRRAGINKFGNAELFYPPKALEFWTLQQCPRRLIELIVLFEDDKIVNGVSDAFSLGHNKNKS